MKMFGILLLKFNKLISVIVQSIYFVALYMQEKIQNSLKVMETALMEKMESCLKEEVERCLKEKLQHCILEEMTNHFKLMEENVVKRMEQIMKISQHEKLQGISESASLTGIIQSSSEHVAYLYHAELNSNYTSGSFSLAVNLISSYYYIMLLLHSSVMGSISY